MVTQHPDEGADPRDSRTHPVVGIGAPDDGLDAVDELLDALDTASVAVVVVLHPTADVPADISGWLAGRTAAPTVLGADQMPLVPGRVLVAPPGAECEVRGGRLWIGPPSDASWTGEPLDRFFRSMAHDLGDRSVAVLVSGTGAGGAYGLRDVQEAGGLTLMQSPEQTGHDPIPRSGADRTLPIAHMARAITRWTAHWLAQPAEPPRPMDAEHFAAVVSYAGATLHRDLRVYKPSTVRRRILRRMALLGIERPEDYLLHMGGEPEEARHLAEQLLVEVTCFFRDPAAFAALTAQIDGLGSDGREDGIRAWVPGCASGEEAYSLAMVLAERFGVDGFRLFATDLSAGAIGRARLGRYPSAALADVSPERRARWFVRDGDGWKLGNSLRRRVTFAQHDLIFEPPFSRIDLVSCRNLLIYLESAAQLKVFQLLHFALRGQGLLFLGSAEAPPGSVRALFEPVDRAHRIFRKRTGTKGHRPPDLALQGERWRSDLRLPARRSQHHHSLVERAILERSLDAAALVDSGLMVLYTYGQIERYLRYPRGAATTGLGGALPTGGAARIRLAIRAVLEGETERITLDVPGHEDDWIRVRVIGVLDDDRALVTFESPPPGADVPGEVGAAVEAELRRVEVEFDQLLGRLQTSNEDLRASHEELLSMNEELQSSNEELETSKEELQSVNEEFAATNAQLQAKLDELEEANADLSNFVAASRIPTLFLDDALRIRRFTPETRRAFRLVPSDVGRPLSDIRHELTDIDLDGALHRVMGGGPVVEREVRATDDCWWRIRVMPYRIGDDPTISGVILTLVDITAQKRQARAAETFRHRLRFALDGSPVSAFTQDEALRYLEVVNPPGGDAARFLGASDDDLDLGPESGRLRAFKRHVLATGEEDRQAFDIAMPGGQLRTFDVRARRTPGPPYRLTVASIDITDSEAEHRQETSDTERRVRRELSTSYLESLGLLAGGVAHDFNNHLMVMLGVTELLRDRVPADEADVLDDFDRAVDASRTLIGQILAFAQSDGSDDETVSFSEVLRRSVELLRPSVPPRVELTVHGTEGNERVRGTFSQLQQVITNLVHNAIQAMPEGGRVTVSVARLDAPPQVELRVRDEGVGIAPDRLARVFEPFYTTRSRTESSGMGLAVVHGVVRSIGGHVEVDSTLGVGSVFAVRLPLTSQGPPPAPRSTASERVRGSGERIAVVDDNDEVGRAMERSLSGRNFEVVRFLDGRALLDALEAGIRFDAVVADVLMPGLDGPATLAAARGIVPDLPAVLVSGFAAGYTPVERVDPLLAKPVSGDALAQAVLERLRR